MEYSSYNMYHEKQMIDNERRAIKILQTKEKTRARKTGQLLKSFPLHDALHHKKCRAVVIKFFSTSQLDTPLFSIRY